MLTVICIYALLVLASGVLGKLTAGTTSLNCLTRFHQDRVHFAPCLNNTCFLFLAQAPFIELDPQMRAERDQVLFPCHNPRAIFTSLGGIAFDIHKGINITDALCVWAGSSCGFDDMVKFVADTARNESTSRYRFGATGLIAAKPDRVSEHAMPTAQLFESEVVILGPSAVENNAVRAAFAQIFRAFETGTWLLILGFIVLLTLLLLIVSCVFSRPTSTINVMKNLFGDPEDSFEIPNMMARDINVRRSRLLHRASGIVLGVAFSGVAVLVLLFYEVSVVNFIFNAEAPQLSKPLNLLTDNELREYAVLRSSAPEDVLRHEVDPSSTRFPNGKPPWVRCAIDKDCYDKLLDEKSPVKYMVALEAEGRWNTINRQACNRLTKYETNDALFLFSGSWYVGTGIPVSTRVEINQKIIAYKATARVRSIVEDGTGLSDKSCGVQKLTIAPSVMAIPLFFLVGPCVLLVAAFTFAGYYVRRKVARTEREMTVRSSWYSLRIGPLDHET